MRTVAWIPAAPFVAASMLVSLASPARAAPDAFAERKHFGVSLAVAPGSTATISGDPMGFSVRMSTDVAIAAIRTGIGNASELSPLQADASHSLPAALVEHDIGASPAAMSLDLDLDLDLVERRAGRAALFDDTREEACKRIALDIFDAAGHAVVGPFLGIDPTSSRPLPTITTFAETYNNATSIASHLYPGRNVVTIQTFPLGPGRSPYEPKGPSTAVAVPAPLPSAVVALGSTAAALMVSGRQRNRRLRHIQ
jgi:hypothetical protein